MSPSPHPVDPQASDVPPGAEQPAPADPAAAASVDGPAGGAGAPADGSSIGRLGRDLVVYTALRVVLIAAIAAILSIFMPLVVAALFAIVLQLPLAWVLFGRQRRRVNDAIATASRHRRADRDRLRAALDGTADASSDTGPR